MVICLVIIFRGYLVFSFLSTIDENHIFRVLTGRVCSNRQWWAFRLKSAEYFSEPIRKSIDKSRHEWRCGEPGHQGTGVLRYWGWTWRGGLRVQPLRWVIIIIISDPFNPIWMFGCGSVFLWVIGDNTRRLVDYGLFVCHWIVFDCWSIEVGCHFFCPGILLATIDCKNFLVGYFVF